MANRNRTSVAVSVLLVGMVKRRLDDDQLRRNLTRSDRW
jgi:hypothetical protein